MASAAATTAAVSAPLYLPARVFGANERIVFGFIGVGGMGTGNLKKHLTDTAAVCDVDQKHMARAVKLVEGKGGKCDAYGDYRKLLERRDIDAVVISTPDHWHARTTVDACEAGKDVYCEKPLSLTVVEGRKMVEAARRNKRVVQTGSMQRSDRRFRLACELVRSGRIGKLQTVLAGIAKTNHPGEPISDSDPPPELDYDFWVGPARWRPYNKNRVHYNFRFFWDYSGGQMTNWGAHYIDIGQWGIGTDDSGPIRTHLDMVEFHPKKWHEVTEKFRVTHTYESGVQLIAGQLQDDIPIGTTFIGEKGRIFVDRRKITSEPTDIVEKPIGEGDVHLYQSNDHHGNFMECIKTREKPICDVEIGHRSATVCHLGNIACRLGRDLRWNPVKEQIIGDDEAAAMLRRPYRAPWMHP
jgi:predicted dehydrogenase